MEIIVKGADFSQVAIGKVYKNYVDDVNGTYSTSEEIAAKYGGTTGNAYKTIVAQNDLVAVKNASLEYNGTDAICFVTLNSNSWLTFLNIPVQGAKKIVFKAPGATRYKAYTFSENKVYDSTPIVINNNMMEFETSSTVVGVHLSVKFTSGVNPDTFNGISINVIDIDS